MQRLAAARQPALCLFKSIGSLLNVVLHTGTFLMLLYFYSWNTSLLKTYEGRALFLGPRRVLSVGLTWGGLLFAVTLQAGAAGEAPGAVLYLSS